MIICICKNISDKEINTQLSSGISSLCELKRSLGVATQCGACEYGIKDLITASHTNCSEKKVNASPPSSMPTLQKSTAYVSSTAQT